MCIKESFDLFSVSRYFNHPFRFFVPHTLPAVIRCAFLVSMTSYFLAWREFAPLAIPSGYGHDVPQYQIYNNSRGNKSGRLQPVFKEHVACCVQQ